MDSGIFRHAKWYECGQPSHMIMSPPSRQNRQNVKFYTAKVRYWSKTFGSHSWEGSWSHIAQPFLLTFGEESVSAIPLRNLYDRVESLLELYMCVKRSFTWVFRLHCTLLAPSKRVCTTWQLYSAILSVFQLTLWPRMKRNVKSASAGKNLDNTKWDLNSREQLTACITPLTTKWCCVFENFHL